MRRGGMVVAIEVKSSRSKDTPPGMDAFIRAFNPQLKLLVGSQGIPVGEFLSVPAETWLS